MGNTPIQHYLPISLLQRASRSRRTAMTLPPSEHACTRRVSPLLGHNIAASGSLTQMTAVANHGSRTSAPTRFAPPRPSCYWNNITAVTLQPALQPTLQAIAAVSSTIAALSIAVRDGWVHLMPLGIVKDPFSHATRQHMELRLVEDRLARYPSCSFVFKCLRSRTHAA